MTDKSLDAERDLNNVIYMHEFNMDVFLSVPCSSYSFALNCTFTVQHTFVAKIREKAMTLHCINDSNIISTCYFLLSTVDSTKVTFEQELIP